MTEKPKKRYSYHKCIEWKNHENEPFNVATEVQLEKTGENKQGCLLVFDTFSKGTPDEYQRKYTNLSCINIGFCPFCGLKLIE